MSLFSFISSLILSPRFITAYLPSYVSFSPSKPWWTFCLQYSSILPFYNVQTEGTSDVSRERQNKRDFIISTVVSANGDREN